MRIPVLISSLAIACGPLLAEDIISGGAAVRSTTGDRPAAGGEARQSAHSWELPAITVYGRPGAELREEDRVGSYGQPRWTARRRFTEARAYVVPEGQIEFEYWLINKDYTGENDDGTPRGNVTQQVFEVEMGLPHRFQLDLYQVWEKEGSTGSLELSETKFEVRYAVADWGRIWGNPTLYAEWAAKNREYDGAEGKLLLADEIAPRWHWAVNFVYERALGGDEEAAHEVVPAISYTVLDERLSVGIEAKFAYENAKGTRSHYQKEILAGPNIQFRPAPQMHINLAWLPEWTEGSDLTSKTTLIAGWEF